MLNSKNTQDKMLSTFPHKYGYFSGGKIVVLDKSFKESKRIVKTLADLSGRDLFLYSINIYGEIYHVRKIVSIQKGGAK